MEAIIEFIDSCCSTIAFLMAVFTLLFLLRGQTQLAGAVKDHLNDDRTVYEQAYTAGRQKGTLTGGELCSVLMGQISCPIRVEGLELVPEEHNPVLFDFDVIAGDYYRCRRYFLDGEIVKLEYIRL